MGVGLGGVRGYQRGRSASSAHGLGKSSHRRGGWGEGSRIRELELLELRGTFRLAIGASLLLDCSKSRILKSLKVLDSVVTRLFK